MNEDGDDHGEGDIQQWDSNNNRKSSIINPNKGTFSHSLSLVSGVTIKDKEGKTD